MKINNINNQNFRGLGTFSKGLREAAGKKFAKIEDIGEGTNIALDFLGKAILVPVIIMAASKEDKEKKEYSAIKNPVAAAIQLGLEVPVLAGGTHLVGKLANEGKLDKEDANYSFNEKLYKDKFIKSLNDAAKQDENLAKKSAPLLEKLDKKGMNKNLKEDFDDLISENAKKGAKSLKNSLDDYDTVHKRLYHLQNRFCFLAAIILTPILCKGEDYLHPKIMKLIKKPESTGQKLKPLSLHQFKHRIKKGGVL